ncbi:MAG: hypothetical protein JOZ62_14525 [Acidobacteriaceae bacterium]|nr:hypothetical protein [Acidobacteriaceae bacterium]
MAAQSIPFPAVHGAGPDLARRTVCIKIERHRLGNSKKVSTSQIEVDTDKSLLRVSKHLFDSPEYTAIRNFDGEITRYLEQICLPFERGVHLCPLPLVRQVDSKMHEFACRRSELVEAFIAVYPELCKSAPGRLRALHNPLDYAPVEQVRAAFAFSWRYVSFGVPEQLREISTEIWTEEREKASRVMSEAVSEVQAVMRSAMAELVRHMQDRLQDGPDGKPVRFHQTTVSKLVEFLDTFEFRNVTDDSELKELVERAKALLSGVTVQALKTTAELRVHVRNGIADIAGQLDGLIVRAGVRKLRLAD